MDLDGNKIKLRGTDWHGVWHDKGSHILIEWKGDHSGITTDLKQNSTGAFEHYGGHTVFIWCNETVSNWLKIPGIWKYKDENGYVSKVKNVGNNFHIGDSEWNFNWWIEGNG